MQSNIQVYNLAHELARALRDSEEYKAYSQAREKAFVTEQNKKMVQEYKKKQYQAQALLLSGEQPDAELIDQINKMGLVLQYNPDIGQYLMAEYRINQMIGDVYRILGDAVELDLDFLKEQQES